MMAGLGKVWKETGILFLSWHDNLLVIVCVNSCCINDGHLNDLFFTLSLISLPLAGNMARNFRINVSMLLNHLVLLPVNLSSSLCL